MENRKIKEIEDLKKRKFFRRLNQIELPFFGKIFGLFLFLEKVELEKKEIYLILKLPKGFNSFLKDLLVFEIKEELKMFFKKINIKVVYFSDLNELYISVQQHFLAHYTKNQIV
jgi:hypothetical protein